MPTGPLTYNCPMCEGEITVPRPMPYVVFGAWRDCPHCGSEHCHTIWPRGTVFAWTIDRAPQVAGAGQ